MKKLKIVGAGFGIAGLILVGLFSSWWVSAGVFIMLFGNNMEQRARTPKIKF